MWASACQVGTHNTTFLSPWKSRLNLRPREQSKKRVKEVHKQPVPCAFVRWCADLLPVLQLSTAMTYSPEWMESPGSIGFLGAATAGHVDGQLCCKRRSATAKPVPASTIDKGFMKGWQKRLEMGGSSG